MDSGQGRESINIVEGQPVLPVIGCMAFDGFDPLTEISKIRADLRENHADDLLPDHNCVISDSKATPTEREWQKYAVLDRIKTKVCKQVGLNHQKMHLRIWHDDSVRAACASQPTTWPEDEYRIRFAPSFFLHASVGVLGFTMRHEIMHIIHGDLDNKAHQARQLKKDAMLKSGSFEELDRLSIESAAQSKRIELARDWGAIRLYPTIAEGLAAAEHMVKALEKLPKTTRQNSGPARYRTHPTSKARIHILRRAAASSIALGL